MKAFDCVDHNKLWKILQEMRIPDHLMYLLRKLYAGQEARQLKPGVEQQTLSKSEKEYIRAVYCHPAYFTSLQNTSCELNSSIPIHFSSLILKMLMLTLVISCLTTSSLPGFTDLPGSYAILFFTALTFTFTTRHIHT